MPRKNTPELIAIRQRMRSQRGQAYWRSLEELAGSDDFQRYLHNEFPEGAAEWSGTNRRDFLALMGASLALAGLTGCRRQPPEEIVPYVRQPETIVPGEPLFFATAMTLGGIATGMLVESHLGRPIKVEGNPRHPSVPAVYWKGDDATAPGVSDSFAQASLLTLYDPDRSQTVSAASQISTWDAFLTKLRSQLESQKQKQGSGVRLLTETVTSPTMAAQIRAFLKLYPEARWHQFEPVNRDQELAGAQLAFGQLVSTRYDLTRADVMLTLDSDLLIEGPDHLRHAFEFANRRDPQHGSKGPLQMLRLYSIESTPTLTGAQADHRLALSVEDIETFAMALADKLGVDLGDATAPNLPEDTRRWLDAVADDLIGARSGNSETASLIVAGRYAAPHVHALVHAMNLTLGNAGETVIYAAPVEAEPALQSKSLSDLVEEMQADRVEVLGIFSGNPVYNAPADLNFSAALNRVPFRFHLGLYENETSARCHWHIPETHFLESWSDARAADGTVSIIQPLIAPLYQGRSPHEVLAALLGDPGETARDIVKQHWHANHRTDSKFETIWRTALHDGFIPTTELPRRKVTLGSLADVVDIASRSKDSGEAVADRVDVIFRPDPTIYDGRFANNGWLQELPKPFSKLTWDNAALISPALARRMELQNGDVIELAHEDRELLAPVWILPGQSDRAVTLHLGYGRSRAGRVGNDAGFNAFALQSTDSPWHLTGVSIKSTSRRMSLATTQHHHLMGGRDLVRRGTLDQLQAEPEHPAFMQSHENDKHTSMLPPTDQAREGYQWAMAIDLNRCIGCNACAIACQSENNIPVVGKEQVSRGREMHWIRIDSYYEGDPEDPRVVHQPVPCMHCENAPCEIVCPVAATVHGDEGLNEMVYNRCVGTRYCSNNCPYKVRRFNFLQYSELESPSLQLGKNPDVTVRNRGVMEKCTYCTQRISAARINAEKADDSIRDGELVTACQAACPSQAIVFGNLNDATSRIHRQRQSPLNYELLGELNTRPRTTYLASLMNPNPELSSSDSEPQP